MIQEEALSRPGVVAVARWFNGMFFLAVSAYGLLSYSPFAYGQFIKPNVVPALTELVIVSPWIFWVALFVTLLTVVPQLRGAPGQRIAVTYLVLWAAVGVFAVISPPLLAIGNTWRGLAVGLVALVPPVWLSVLDHVARPAPAMTSSDRSRALAACGWSAMVAWATYALAVPFRMWQAVGIPLSANALLAAFGASLVFDLFAFMTLFLALAAASGAAALARRRTSVEYWLWISLLAVCSADVLYFLVCASLTFVGWAAAIASAALGVALAVLWADLALLRLQRPQTRALDTLDVFGAPIAGGRPRVAAAVLVLLPLLAFGLADAVSRFDWNFLLQKISVLLVWLATFSAVYAVTRRRRRDPRHAWLVVAIPLLAFGLYHAIVWWNPRVVLDRYAAVDPSFRLIRDARTALSADTAHYYAYLRSQTLIPSPRIPPIDIDFVKPLSPSERRKPNIFLLIVDSMRRDYLSPYNDGVTFTPGVARLAADSYVFDRAFTRYAGTAMAVPSIWAGGMMLHSLDQPAFGRRNALLKLLDANHYVRMMDIDHIISDLVPSDANIVELDKGKGTMQIDVCTTTRELEARLTNGDRSRPVFFYSLPQNVHISIATRRTVPPGESYPGFFAPVASSVHRADACVGDFVDFLKRENLYDDSIVILTSDHGDSMGEEGRWGHAHFIVPEVMRIPLIIHLPSWLRARVSADLSALAFSTDITPSLYALLGYEPADLGPLFGRPLFVSPDADASWRRRERFLLGSSYGTVFATLRHNGRALFVVDTVDGRDNAFDIGRSLAAERRELTQAMMAENRALIREQLTALSRQYHSPPSP